MISRVIHTDIVDDMEEAAEEIFEGFSGFEFAKNSLGVVFCEMDVDYPELYKELSNQWDFPIMGCTAMCMIADEGFLHGGITVLVMSGDDVSFSVGMTDRLTRSNYEHEVNSLFEKLISKTDGDVKLLYGYSDSIKSPDDVPGEAILKVLSNLIGNVPMFGGVASDDMDFGGSRVFFNERSCKDTYVMALISGNIEPKYEHVISVDDSLSSSYTITESDDNVVYKVGDYTFIEALEREGFNTEKSDVMRDYMQTPFLLTTEFEGEEYTMARSLSFLNHEDGSGVFLGSMPEGARLEVGFMNRDYVKASLEKTMYTLIKETTASEHNYSTALCCSCVSRFLVMSNQIEGESMSWVDRRPENISFMGMYSYGEVCPIKGREPGKFYNAFHNITFTLLAI